MSPMKTPPKAGMLNDATLSLHQAAKRLGIPLRELKALLGCGELSFVEISGELRVPVLGLAAYKNTRSDSQAHDAALQAEPSSTQQCGARRKSGKPPQRKRHPQ